MPNAVPLYWHAARWREQAPGTRGLVWLAMITASLCVPVERFGAGLTWTTQAQLLVNLGIALAAIAFGREVGHADDAERWLVLRGFTPADWALARWSANLVPLSAIGVLWALTIGVVSAVLKGTGLAWSGVIGLGVHLVLTAATFTLVLMALGASGAKQTAEGLLVVLILTFALPLAAERLPPVMVDGLRILLPPLDAIAGVRSAATHQRWPALLQSGLRLGAWGGAVLGLALLGVNRRVPERPPRPAEPPR